LSEVKEGNGPLIFCCIAAWKQLNKSQYAVGSLLNSALQVSAAKGHVGICQLLLKCNADPKMPGAGPLHYSCINGCLEISRLLLEYSANPNVLDGQ
jgi:hypothetical protein